MEWKKIIKLIPTLIFSISSLYFMIELLMVDENKTVVVPLRFLYAIFVIAFMGWAKSSYNDANAKQMSYGYTYYEDKKNVKSKQNQNNHYNKIKKQTTKGGENVPDYLYQLKYEPEAAKQLIAKPHSREEFMRPEIEKLGGKIKGLWFSLGRFDVVVIVTLPDNISMKALSMASTATGYIKDFKATPLLSVDESIEAMKKASTIEIKMPGK